MRDAGHRMPEKAKIIYPPPRGVDITIGKIIFGTLWIGTQDLIMKRRILSGYIS